MLTKPELTIVIPAKNEARNLPRLLTCLSRQDYPLLPLTRVYVADAGSSDGTPSLAAGFADRLRISVIAGGLPAAGRNRGARLATTPYVLFIDADIEFDDTGLLRRAIETMKRRRLHCLTTNIRCNGGGVFDRLLFAGNNLVQRVASWSQPFATGMFMMFDRQKFVELDGFDERALYAEDYLLSKQVSVRRFGILKGHILTSNRRFQKMGHLKIARMFLNTALHTFDRTYFFRDQNYWTEVDSGTQAS
jgi:glycosyltransferase involved in cell wall biosynthesis